MIDEFIRQFETNPKIKKHKILFDISAVALDKDSEGIPKRKKVKLTDAEIKKILNK